MLADHGWRVVMPQFRGFDCIGDDDERAESVNDYAKDVADLMETLGIDSAVIGGLSMGGYVALALYRYAPELFRALVLADSRAEADGPEARANRTRLSQLAASGGAAAIADDMLPRLLGSATRSADSSIEPRVRALILANEPAVLQAALQAMMTRPDSTQLLKDIVVPTLVVVGADDQLTPQPMSAAMASTIPSAELCVLPDAGHLSNLEQPQAFNAALLAFLGRL